MMFLDTSGLFTWHHRDEPLHHRAREAYKAARVRLTHSYVLAEVVALAVARRIPRQPVLAFLTDLLDSPDVELVWVDETLHREALALLFARKDKDYSLCDAVSFVLMRGRGINEVLTTDHHFEQEGFLRLL
jgi:predicted nucleic acid-binding protein